jgi:hypothetical protein
MHSALVIPGEPRDLRGETRNPVTVCVGEDPLWIPGLRRNATRCTAPGMTVSI